jgi:DNA primase
MEEATTRYQEALTGREGAYLEGRGIDRHLAGTFRLGVVRDPFPEHKRFEGFLAIPYLDHASKALTLRFRCIEEHDHRAFGHGKYMSSSGDPARVFNIRAIHQADDVIHVTEGELDAITLNKVGLPAIAIPGATGWRSHHRLMLAGFSRVYVWGDPDDAGVAFTQKVTSSLRRAKGVRLADGKDVNETYLAGGANALLALIEGRAP